MFNLDSSSVEGYLIGLFVFRSKPVSNVYQHRSRDGEIWERTVKDTAAWKLTPDSLPDFISATG